MKGFQVCSNEEPFTSNKIKFVFSSPYQHYDKHNCLLIGTVFSGEQRGPLDSCFLGFFWLSDLFLSSMNCHLSVGLNFFASIWQRQCPISQILISVRLVNGRPDV